MPLFSSWLSVRAILVSENSGTPGGNFLKFVTNVHMDSRMNWLDLGDQRWKVILTTEHIFGHNSIISTLVMTKCYIMSYKNTFITADTEKPIPIRGALLKGTSTRPPSWICPMWKRNIFQTFYFLKVGCLWFGNILFLSHTIDGNKCASCQKFGLKL